MQVQASSAPINEGEIFYVSGPATNIAAPAARLPLRFCRKVRGSTTEISVVTSGGRQIGVYGVMPRLVTPEEARDLLEVRTYAENRSISADAWGRLIQTVGFEVPASVGAILKEAAYVAPHPRHALSA